jgi:twitching motility protein PilT
MDQMNPNIRIELSQLLDSAIDQRASDLHIQAGSAPMLRIDGVLRPLDLPAYDAGKAHEVITGLIGSALHETMGPGHEELDMGFSYREVRFRVNAFYTSGNLAASLRLLKKENLDMQKLGIAPVLASMCERSQGLIVVSGPTGHGKSTTLASLINHISEQRRSHIITIEDPVEYIFESKKSLISQREIGSDTRSFATALRAALREDPDVVLVGEMRDLETIEAALQLAETGHLVLTTVHTNSAAQTAERIIGAFPPNQQSQVRQQLSEMLLGIVSQRLVPRIQGGRVLASEVLVANPAVRTILREGKTHQLPNLIQTSAAEGMITLEKSLANLVISGEISMDDAMEWAVDQKNLKSLVY